LSVILKQVNAEAKRATEPTEVGSVTAPPSRKEQMKTLRRVTSNERSKDNLDQLSSQIAIESNGDAFGKFATTAAGWLGSKWAFVVAILIIAIWAITGPLFYYSDTWQLVINTGTTSVTFLMVFLI
jgi:hypothetical protein